MSVARRLLVIVAVAAAAVCATHDRVVAFGDVVAATRDTVDIGDHVVAVVEPETRVTFEVRKRRVLDDERASVQQLSGRAIYRVDEHVRATIASFEHAIDVECDEPAVVVVTGDRYAVAGDADGCVHARGLIDDPSLTASIDDANDAAGSDLRVRLAQLEAMRAELRRERESSASVR